MARPGLRDRARCSGGGDERPGAERARGGVADLGRTHLALHADREAILVQAPELLDLLLGAVGAEFVPVVVAIGRVDLAPQRREPGALRDDLGVEARVVVEQAPARGRRRPAPVRAAGPEGPVPRERRRCPRARRRGHRARRPARRPVRRSSRPRAGACARGSPPRRCRPKPPTATANDGASSGAPVHTAGRPYAEAIAHAVGESPMYAAEPAIAATRSMTVHGARRRRDARPVRTSGTPSSSAR